jgi:RNA polymerase sigma-70 factor, ECF subfamily
MFLSGKNKIRFKEQEELAYSFAPKMYRLAYGRLGNREDAEDIVQEAYLKAFKSIAKFRPGTNMDSWLTTIVLNTIRDHIRRVTKEGDVLALDMIVSETECLPERLICRKTPDALLEETEISSELSSALRDLPPYFLLPLLLKDLHEFSYKEIASSLDIPIGTVMSRLARARDFLRQRLLGSTSAVKQGQVWGGNGKRREQ